MKTRILTSLALLFALFTSGSLVALFTFGSATDLYGQVVTLHQIEDLRRELLATVFKIQGALLTNESADRSAVAAEVATLNVLAGRCTSCHHAPATAARVRALERDIVEFRERLNAYLEAPKGGAVPERLGSDAAGIGTAVLAKIEAMSAAGTEHLQKISIAAGKEARQGKILLAATFLLTCLAGAMVALHLTRFITRPVRDFVEVTRVIATGNLGHTLTGTYRAEFGEIARAINSMSLSLKRDQDVLLREMAERRVAVAALRRSEERYALAERGSNDGLWDWDLDNDSMYFSARWKSMLGYPPEALGSTRGEWFRLVHADDIEHLRSRIAAHISGDSEHLTIEHRARHRDGSYRWVQVRGIAVRDAAGKARRMAGSQTDITARKLVEQRLVHEALHDVLTGLPNRALFVNRLQHAFDAAPRHKTETFALLFLDLDRFKYVNDSHGHAAGDQLLRAFAARLAESVRPGDTVARFGGDEFAVLLSPVNHVAEATQVAGRVLAASRRPFRLGEVEQAASVSIGIALATARHEGPDQLLRDADLALYQAKSGGKARYAVFDSGGNTLDRLHLETALRGALVRKELRLHYQPIFDLRTQSVSGFEALLRWEHPERGIIPPMEFISIAEDAGLIDRIGEWVLREACAKLGEYAACQHAGPALRMNVNLSSRQLTPQLIDQVARILRETGVAPHCLGLEITESVMLADSEATARLLHGLRRMGVVIHIDDFGTGYSSLSYLHRIPVDVLKIDKSFFEATAGQAERLEIAKTITALAKILKLEVIAEGVESQSQLDLLEEWGCRYVQGYLIAHPAPMSDRLDANCAQITTAGLKELPLARATVA